MSGLRGTFVTLEGGDGAGKTTLHQALVERAEAAGHEVVACREPGGTALGERLREALQASRVLDRRAELLIFETARAQLVAQVIRPALSRGALVLCDRFADSSLAYQHSGRGLPISVVASLNEFATDGLVPDLTLLLDLDPEVARRRRGRPTDQFEREERSFHERVRAGFLTLAQGEPERWIVLDAEQSEDVVADLAWQTLRRLLRCEPGQPG